MAKTDESIARKDTTYIALRQVGENGSKSWEEVGSVSAPNQEQAKRRALGDLTRAEGFDPSTAVTIVVIPLASFKPSTGRVEVAEPRLVLS